MAYPEVTVGAIVFNKENKLLLCKSHKWNNQYVIPGGHVELGESMEEALKREIMEETGLGIYNIKLFGIKECIYSDTFHEQKHFIFMDYVCQTNTGKVQLNEEAEEYVWIRIEDMDEYDLGGFTRDLLKGLKNQDENTMTKILYNY